MKLRRFLAAVLAFVLIISNSPLEFITFAAEEPQKIAAINESKVLRSAAVKYTEGAAFLERGNTNGIYGDDPRIDTLLTQAPGEFNKSGEEWVWIAYKVTVPTGGTYTLGVETNSCMPCVKAWQTQVQAERSSIFAPTIRRPTAIT